MIVTVAAGEARIAEALDLKRLAVVVTGELDPQGLSTALDGLGRLDGDHVWLDVAALEARAAATLPEADRAAWAESFGSMIGYATSKGWTDPTGKSVRAHIERG